MNFGYRTVIAGLLGVHLMSGHVFNVHADVARSPNPATATGGLVYIGAYPSRSDCDDAGREFVGADYFCYEDANDGRPVWELWLSSN